MVVKKSLKNLKFDEALAMLEEKVKLLEEGNLPLEESLEVFKEGALLGKVYLTMAKRLNNGATQDYLQLAKEALEAAYSARPFGELKDIAYGKVFGVANITCNEIIFQVMYLQGTDEGSYFAKNFQP